MGLLIDLIPNSPAKIMGIIWQTIRRIANEILGVQGLNLFSLGVILLSEVILKLVSSTFSLNVTNLLLILLLSLRCRESIVLTLVYSIPSFLNITHIFLLNCTFFTVISIRNTRSTTYYTATLIRAIVAFITYTHQCTGTHIGVANDTFTITYA